MKIKIIDLLNKIANGELEPYTKFKYDDSYCMYSNNTIDVYTDKTYKTYDFSYDEVINFICLKSLNDEAEIIEEPKKINKIRIDYNSINIDKAFETGTTTFFREKDIEIFQCLSSKINEIIDKINEVE